MAKKCSRCGNDTEFIQIRKEMTYHGKKGVFWVTECDECGYFGPEDVKEAKSESIPGSPSKETKTQETPK